MLFDLWKYYFSVFRYKLHYLLFVMIVGTFVEGLGLAVVVAILDRADSVFIVEKLASYGVEVSIYALLIGLFLVRGLVVWFANFETARMNLQLKSSALEQSLELSVFAKFETIEALGDNTLTNLVIKEIPNIAVGFKAFMHMLRSTLLSIVYVAIPISIAPELALVLFSFALFGLAIYFPIQRFLKRLSSSLVLANEQLLWRLKSIFGSLPSIKAGNQNVSVVQRGNEKIREIIKLESKQTVTVEPAVSGLLETVIFLLLISTIIYNDIEGWLDEAVLILVIGMLYKALTSINSIYATYRKIITYSGSFVKFSQLKEKLAENREHLFGNEDPLDLHRITIQNVSLLRDGNPVLDNISLECRIGETVAIVGRSGSGKTTLLNVLSTLISQDSGHYFANLDTDVSSNPLFIRNNTCYLTQQYSFDAELVKDNFEDDFASNKFVCNSLQSLDLIKCESEFIGFGEKQISQLSGGERQRLSLILEFNKNRCLYFLDEITSALNIDHENMVADYIQSVSKDKIIIAVTHSENLAAKFSKTIDLSKNHQELEGVQVV